jgi:hypothetical protein
MGSLDSNDSYRPFPSMNQKRVVAGELSQGQVGDMLIRLPNPVYVYVLIPPICHSQSSFVVRHCTFRPTRLVLVEQIYHQPTIHSRRRRRPATTQRLRDHYDRYYSSSEESNEYSQTEVDEPQVAHSLHEDRLDAPLDEGTIGLHDRTDDRSERWSCNTFAKPGVCLRVDSTNLSLSVFICCKTLYISPNMFGSCWTCVCSRVHTLFLQLRYNLEYQQYVLV